MKELIIKIERPGVCWERFDKDKKPYNGFIPASDEDYYCSLVFDDGEYEPSCSGIDNQMEVGEHTDDKNITTCKKCPFFKYDRLVFEK